MEADTRSLHFAVPPNFGAFGNEADAMTGLVCNLVCKLDPSMIWLFGSRARGDARPDSDFDLLVVAKDEGDFGSDDYERAYAAVSDLGLGVDVVPCDHETYVASMGLRTSFVRHLSMKGNCSTGTPDDTAGTA